MIEKTVDAVLADYEARKLRLWLANFRDTPVELGQWAGLVMLRAQAYPGEWKPDRSELLNRIRGHFGSDDAGLSTHTVTESLLALSRDRFAADLATKGVPREIAKRPAKCSPSALPFSSGGCKQASRRISPSAA